MGRQVNSRLSLLGTCPLNVLRWAGIAAGLVDAACDERHIWSK